MAEPTLKNGSKGQAVKDLQEALTQVEHAGIAVDGAFGSATEQAVKTFQSARGIQADGIVGKITWTNIDEADQSEPVLKQGSAGLPVRRLQSRASAAGFDTGGVDGRFGSHTDAAVKKLQKGSNLTADGVVGPKTWAVVDAFDV